MTTTNRGSLLTVALFVLGGWACALPPSPIVPEVSQPAQIQAQTQAQMVAVRVKVWDRASQTQAIIGAEVRVGGQLQGEVRDPGGVEIYVPVGIEVTIRADAPGYYGIEADGMINHAGETWQFWLLKGG